MEKSFTGVVSAIGGACIWWESIAEPGFALLSLKGLKSGEKKCLKSLNQHAYYLTIDEGLLKPGLFYKFAINAMALGGGPIAASTITIQTVEELDIGGASLEVRNSSHSTIDCYCASFPSMKKKMYIATFFLTLSLAWNFFDSFLRIEN